MSVLSTGARTGESFWSHAARSFSSSCGGWVVQACIGGAAVYVSSQDPSWAIGMAESMIKSQRSRSVIVGVGAILASSYFLNWMANVSNSSLEVSGDKQTTEIESEWANARILLSGLEEELLTEDGSPGPVLIKLPLNTRINRLVGVYDDNRAVAYEENLVLKNENARLHGLVKRVDKCPPMTSLEIATFIIENKADLAAKIETLAPHAKAQVKEHLEVQKFLSFVARSGGEEAEARRVAERAATEAAGRRAAEEEAARRAREAGTAAH